MIRALLLALLLRHEGAQAAKFYRIAWVGGDIKTSSFPRTGEPSQIMTKGFRARQNPVEVSGKVSS